MYKFKNCNSCSLSLFRNNIIKGKGKDDSDIMMILDTPSKIEDEEGEIMISKPNLFLNHIIECLNLNDVSYITYLVKCKPPGLRQADNDAVYSCKIKHLYEEVMTLKPKMIILFGANPTKAFFNLKQSILTLAGFYGRFNSIIYCLNYSPIMAIKDENIKIEFINNMYKFGKIYREYINPIHSFNSIKELYNGI